MKQYIVHAFTDQIFHGNPAAVCVLEDWISEEIMMKIAKENKLSETAFVVKEGENYHLRWFTPESEIDLCGHATLSTGFVILNYVEPDLEKVVFDTLSGLLTVTKREDRYEMDFPVYDLKPVRVTQDMAIATGAFPKRAYMGRDLLLIYNDEQLIREMTPDIDGIRRLDGTLVHVTAPGKEYDCVSRSFGPKIGIDEDPVCGSAHCHIAPYWSKYFEKEEIKAYQASERGGELYCKMNGERILISGKAVLFSECVIHL